MKYKKCKHCKYCDECHYKNNSRFKRFNIENDVYTEELFKIVGCTGYKVMIDIIR